MDNVSEQPVVHHNGGTLYPMRKGENQRMRRKAREAIWVQAITAEFTRVHGRPPSKVDELHIRGVATLSVKPRQDKRDIQQRRLALRALGLTQSRRPPKQRPLVPRTKSGREMLEDAGK